MSCIKEDVAEQNKSIQQAAQLARDRDAWGIIRVGRMMDDTKKDYELCSTHVGLMNSSLKDL